MEERAYPENDTNLDKNGNRKSSPAASQIYEAKIINASDPDGMREAEINRLAKRLSKLDREKDRAQYIRLREKLAAKCLKFFKIAGDGDIGEGELIFSNVLIKVIDAYDSSKGQFTHMLRFYYKRRRTDEAYSRAREDTAFGGGNDGCIVSLDAATNNDGSSSKTYGDYVGSEDDGNINWDMDDAEMEQYLNSRKQPEEKYDYSDVFEDDEEDQTFAADEADYSFAEDEFAEDEILLNTISLITRLFERTDKQASDARKLYTKMFFSETLTRITKIRTEGELYPLERQEKGLFNAVELPFQDSYTIDICRTIYQLWCTAFVEGVRDVEAMLNDELTMKDSIPKNRLNRNYTWHLPASVYIEYLHSIGYSASNATVSQQRSKYDQLLQSLSERVR